MHGVGNYIVVSFGSSQGFQIFDVSNPLLARAQAHRAARPPVQGVAIWNQGSSYYLAARLGTTCTDPAAGDGDL